MKQELTFEDGSFAFLRNNRAERFKATAYINGSPVKLELNYDGVVATTASNRVLLATEADISMQKYGEQYYAEVFAPAAEPVTTVYINGKAYTDVHEELVGAILRAESHVEEDAYISAHAIPMPTEPMTQDEFNAFMTAVPVFKAPHEVAAALATPVVDETSTTEATTNTTIPEEEITMTTNNTATETVATATQVTKATTVVAGNIIKDQATAILENVKAGVSTATEAVKSSGFKAAVSEAWALLKAKDFKGFASKAFDAFDAGVDAVENWFSNTKSGRTTAYIINATAAMTVVGLFTGSIGVAVVGGAVAYTVAKAFFDRDSFTVKGFAKDLAVSLVAFPVIALVAYIIVPYIAVAVSYISTDLALGLMLPGFSVFF